MKKILITIILLVATLSLAGCAMPSGGGTQTSAEKVWPSEIGGSVPKFQEEKIKQVKKTTTATLMSFENVTEADYDAYITEVEKGGWEVSFTTNERSKSFKKGEERLDLTYKDSIILLDYIK